MAKNDNLTDFLTDVASAIRAKKGTTDKINPQDFSSEIESIEAGGAGNPIIAKSEAEMTALLTDENVGKYVMYIPEEEVGEKVWSPVEHVRKGDFLTDLYFNTSVTPDFSELNWDNASTESDGSLRVDLVDFDASGVSPYLNAYKISDDEYAIKLIDGSNKDYVQIIYQSTTGWNGASVHLDDSWKAYSTYQQPIWEQWISKTGEWEQIKKVEPIKDGDEFNGIYFNYNIEPVYPDTLDWGAPSSYAGEARCVFYIADSNGGILAMIYAMSQYDGDDGISGDTVMLYGIVGKDSDDYSEQFRSMYMYNSNNEIPSSFSSVVSELGWSYKQPITKEYLKEAIPDAVEPFVFSIAKDDPEKWMNWNLFGQVVSTTPFPAYRSGQAYVVVKNDDDTIAAKGSYDLNALDKNASVRTIHKGYSGYNDRGELVVGEALQDIGGKLIANKVKGEFPKEYLESIDGIGPYAFAGKDDLTKIVIPSNIGRIYKDAFMGCPAEIVIESAPKSIVLYSEAFTGYSTSESKPVTLSRSFSVVGDTLPSALQHVNSTDVKKLCESKGSILDETSTVYLNGEVLSNLDTTDKNVDYVGDNIFENNNLLESVTLILNGTGSGRFVGESAFENCVNLKRLHIEPSNNTASTLDGLCPYAFKGCTSLTDVSFGGYIRQFQTGCFEDCTGLKSISLPDAMTIKDIFKGCSNIEFLSIPKAEISYEYRSTYHLSYIFGDNSTHDSFDSVTYQLSSISGTKYTGYVPKTLKSLEIRSEYIGPYFCMGLSLESLHLPNVTRAGDGAFNNLSLSDGLYITDLSKFCSMTIGSSDSGSPVGGGKLYLNNELVSSLIIPEGITSFWPVVKGCTSITEVTLPQSLEEIVNSAFANCINLSTINFAINGQLTLIGSSAFYNCSKLTSITIPDSVTSIGSNAFFSCESLTSVTFGENSQLMSIGSRAFYNCSKLTSITIPESVTSINFIALSIGSETNKATITFLSTTPPSIDSSTFFAEYLNKIIVPKGSGEAYKAATNWSVFADYIEEAEE